MEHIVECFPKVPSPCHCLNIRRASQAVTQFYENILAPSGLKLTQYSLLRHLEMAEPVVTISELANFMRIDRTTLNRKMKPLIEAGLIEVATGKDPRCRQIMLTDAGRSALSAALKLWDNAQTLLQEYLGETELAQFKHIIAKLEALTP
ncbi:MAG TPA: MarR family winged helix-turn-helix transcriptional regulator [Methylomusa anaerophila]|uniref:MarR family protein n=1 Tax=Methylomusa anaerophila TaxID=1930071 RepID=A0A348AGH8_9FIRM|nr:MarR family winged helix-turn-helix transcriptional regulator [Methylomusa anaerophila]BBB90176.1 MarR family protein [Methylomusa anaerophila]HML88098.1 MarR family winged helix-turn-helix transcriptional regulator [Methylomusa anaerophila]